MKIKIFFFIPSLEFGGAGNASINLLKNLDQQLFDVSLFYQGKNRYRNEIPKYINIYKLHKKKTFLNFFKIRKIIKKQIRNNNKNIFISNIHFSNVLSIIFLRNLKNLKIILFERTSIKELDLFKKTFNIKNIFIRFLVKRLYFFADLVLTNSKYAQKELLKFNVQSKIIYSGLLNKIRKKKKFKRKFFFKIISVGRLVAQKDYFTMINAIKYIEKKKFKLFIYGEGKLRKLIQNYIDNNHLSKKIILMGHIKNKNFIYENSDLLLISSLFEGIPNCVVEAINYSVPIIASKNFGGNKEVLDNGKFGDLFELQNYKQLANKIEKFMEKPSILQKKVLLGSGSIDKFLIMNTAEKFEKILLTLCKS
jgi:glycosyltransferase involved in cell wall biosynthesis